jgi:hypothetical protein
MVQKSKLNLVTTEATGINGNVYYTPKFRKHTVPSPSRLLSFQHLLSLFVQPTMILSVRIQFVCSYPILHTPSVGESSLDFSAFPPPLALEVRGIPQRANHGVIDRCILARIVQSWICPSQYTCVDGIASFKCCCSSRVLRDQRQNVPGRVHRRYCQAVIAWRKLICVLVGTNDINTACYLLNQVALSTRNPGFRFSDGTFSHPS